MDRFQTLLSFQRAALHNGLNEKVQKLHRDLEEQIHTNTQLLAENSQKQVELKVKEDEIQQIKLEAMRVNKIRENTLNKLKIVEKQKMDTEKVRRCRLKPIKTRVESAWSQRLKLNYVEVLSSIAFSSNSCPMRRCATT